MKQWTDYLHKSHCLFHYDERLIAWINSILPYADATMTDPANAEWWRWGNTWFAGVNVLPNDKFGACETGLPLQGEAYEFAKHHIPLCDDLDKAQISVCTKGYPKDDGTAGFAFRQNKDAAHLDGLIKENNRRFMQEYHGYILGIALNEVDAKSAPVIVYEGSHKIVQAWLQKRFAGERDWDKLDLTDEYNILRQEVLQSCPRTILPLRKGEAFILHRHSIHGTARWESEATTPRKLAFFRPAISVSKTQWLDD